jgi:hypothetical protein
MVALRSLGRFDRSPSGDSWILIEECGGRYFITGKQRATAADISIAPAPAHTPAAAIRGAISWADLLAVQVIYVREVPIDAERGFAFEDTGPTLL